MCPEVINKIGNDHTNSVGGGSESNENVSAPIFNAFIICSIIAIKKIGRDTPPPPPIRDASYLCPQNSRVILSLQYEKVIYVWTCLTWHISMSTCDLFMSTSFTLMLTCNLNTLYISIMISHADKIYLAYMGLIKFEKFASVVYDKFCWPFSTKSVNKRYMGHIAHPRNSSQQYTSLSTVMIISPYWMKEKKSKESLSPFW